MKKSLVEVMSAVVPIVSVLFGLMLISGGIALIYIPAGVVVLGVELLVFEYYLRVRGR